MFRAAARPAAAADSRPKDLQGILFVILSAVIFGCIPVITKTIYASGGNAVSAAAIRNSLIAPLLWGFLRHKGVSVRLSRRQMRRMVMLALDRKSVV